MVGIEFSPDHKGMRGFSAVRGGELTWPKSKIAIVAAQSGGVRTELWVHQGREDETVVHSGHLSMRDAMAELHRRMLWEGR